jgi:hypothetical protein
MNAAIPLNVNTVMNFRVSLKESNSFTSWTTISLSRSRTSKLVSQSASHLVS